MKGRDGDLFYRALAKESLEKQLQVIKKLGFSGIYLDLRGFDDNGHATLHQLMNLLGAAPVLTRKDNEVVFFKLDPFLNDSLLGLNSAQIMEKAGYVVDKLGKRYTASFSDGIDFTRDDWPEFVQSVNGLSVAEKGGRWSDANINPVVRIEFFSVLPQNFTLVITGFPFVAVKNQAFVVKIGANSYQMQMSAGINELRVPVSLRGEQVSYVELIPSNPTSPAQLGISADRRRLGVGLVKLRFE